MNIEGGMFGKKKIHSDIAEFEEFGFMEFGAGAVVDGKPLQLTLIVLTAFLSPTPPLLSIRFPKAGSTKFNLIRFDKVGVNFGQKVN